MISRTLLRQIEQNAHKLAGDLVQAVKQDVRGKAYHNLPDQRFEELVLDLYKNLGRWLRSRSWGALRNVYEGIGRRRYLDGMPLNNVIFSFTTTKCMLLDYIRGAMEGDQSERDMELELVFAISQFFDKAIYHIVTGYEDARQATEAHPRKSEAQQLAGKRQLAAVAGAAFPLDEPDGELPLSRSGDIGEVSG